MIGSGLKKLAKEKVTNYLNDMKKTEAFATGVKGQFSIVVKSLGWKFPYRG